MIRYLGMYSRRLAQGAILWLFLFSVGSAFADNSKISPDLLPLLSNPANQVNVIVQYSSLQTCNAGGLLGGLLCTVVNLVGGVLNLALGIINGLVGTMSAGDVITTSNQSNVDYISLDRPVRPMLDQPVGAEPP